MKPKHIILLALFFTGCQKIYFKDDPKNDSEKNFDVFWDDFNKYYAQFNLRHIDWDSVYSVYRPQVTSSTSERQLFEILAKMVGLINDMHVNLYTPIGTASWKTPYPTKYPSNKLINPYKYLIGGSQQPSPFEYRDMLQVNIGYIIIYTFATNGKVTNSDNDNYLKIDNILDEFKDKDGIIIDVRWNGGGNSNYAKTVASRFADTTRIASKSKSKNGPGKNDFTDWSNSYIEPGGSFQFKKPVVVLTSRATSSSAESFVMYMNVLPQVTVVGDTTGGGCGNPIFRELQNGWTYRLSTKIEATANNYNIEGKGIPPDIAVQTSVSDSINGIDRILEKGIEVIEKTK